MISATRPIQPAIEWTKKILFAPFNLEKWFVMGFCAFLATLTFNMPGLNFPFTGAFQDLSKNGNPEHLRQIFSQRMDQTLSWVNLNLVLFIILGVLALLTILVISILLQWLSSRGIFMFLDNVIRNEARVSAAWDYYKEKAWSLFSFRVIFNFVSLPLFLAVILLCYYTALPDIRTLQFGPSAILGIVLAIILIPTTIIGIATVHMLLVDFIAPIMVLRNIKVMDAWRVFIREIMPGQTMPLTWFYAMRFVFSLLVGILTTLGCCCTLGLALLPYISSVVFLPVHVFFRSYALTFLGEWGPNWQLIETKPKG